MVFIHFCSKWYWMLKYFFSTGLSKVSKQRMVKYLVLLLPITHIDFKIYAKDLFIWFLHKFKIFRFIKFNGKLTKASSTKATVQSDGQRPEWQPHDWWFFITLLEDLSVSERQIWFFLVVVYFYIGVMYSCVRGEICRCRKHSRPDQK